MGLYIHTSLRVYNEFRDGRWAVEGAIRYECQKIVLYY